MILFAYAGNMDVAQFAKTAPSAKKIGIDKLPGYNLVFNKTADDLSSKANVEKSDDPGSVVWGVLIELDDKERNNFFNPDTWSIDFKLELLTCFDTDDNIYQAEVFMAQPHAVNIHLLPYNWYHAKITGLAKDAGLPDEYISQLYLMPHKADPDETRRARRANK